MLEVSTMKKIGLFVGGVLFGTAGVKVLSSKDAKKFYTNCTAAALRAKDCVMQTAATVQENAEDILAEAQEINEKRAAEEAAKMEEDAATEENAGAEDYKETEV
ncbi:MAG TPA: hypothetical protein H9730_05590 [Candidatus Mediterraneibacter stercoripullorum]|nr:hypothetical protein [Candidatus Mediterraneibacter stercoripullorum]